jgi:hypothetical protein
VPADRTLHQSYEEALELYKSGHKADKDLVTKYMSLVGALIYVVPSVRADIAHPVGLLARALTFPTLAMYAHAQRVIAYLGQNADTGITYDVDAPDASTLVGYSDSDWGVAQSTTGWAIKLAGAVVAWSSRRQHSIALSSTEAEIIAASEAAVEIVYLRGLLAEMGLRQTKPTVLYVDNTGAVELSRDHKSCKRSRHVERRYLKVRELVAAGEVEVRFIPTAKNPADILTKSTINSDVYRNHATNLMNIPNEP